MIDQVFLLAASVWRGLGDVQNSAVRFKQPFADFDAMTKFSIPHPATDHALECSCGSVLTGITDPINCELFGSICTPDSPAGPSMVTPHGPCAAWFKYNRKKK